MQDVRGGDWPGNIASGTEGHEGSGWGEGEGWGLVVSPLAQQVVARRGRASLRDRDLVAAGARGGAGPLDL